MHPDRSINLRGEWKIIICEVIPCTIGADGYGRSLSNFDSWDAIHHEPLPGAGSGSHWHQGGFHIIDHLFHL